MSRLLPGLLMLATLAATACTSPQSRYYTLGEHGGDAPAVAVGSIPVSTPTRLGVYVAEVTVPEAVDRQPLVIGTEASRVRVQEFDQWAAPLDAQITRVMIGNLRRILGVQTVAGDLEQVGTPKPLRLRMVVEQFDGKAGPGASVTVRARWSITRSDPGQGQPVVGTATVTRPVAGSGLDAVVAGWNDALWEVSQDVAKSLVAANRP